MTFSPLLPDAPVGPEAGSRRTRRRWAGATGVCNAGDQLPGCGSPYARLSPSGFVQIRSDEQEAWTGMATRLGGLISALTPLQPAGILGGGLPKIEGNANCVSGGATDGAGRRLQPDDPVCDAGRAAAAREPSTTGSGRPSTTCSADIAKDGRATGEAQLLLTGGGMPLASATADAAPRDLLNLFDGGRDPEREVPGQLVGAMGTPAAGHGAQRLMKAAVRPATDSRA